MLKSFEGRWKAADGTRLLIKAKSQNEEAVAYVDDGTRGILELKAEDTIRLRFDGEDDEYEGKINNADQISWEDGDVWTRAKKSVPVAAKTNGRANAIGRTFGILKQVMEDMGYTVDAEDTYKGFMDYGVRSADFHMLADKLSAKLGIKVDMGTLLDYPSLASLGAHIDANLQESRQASSFKLVKGLMEKCGYKIDDQDLDKGFMDYGMRSEELTRMVSMFRVMFGVPISMGTLLDYPSIVTFCKHVDDLLAVRQTATREPKPQEETRVQKEPPATVWMNFQPRKYIVLEPKLQKREGAQPCGQKSTEVAFEVGTTIQSTGRQCVSPIEGEWVQLIGEAGCTAWYQMSGVPPSGRFLRPLEPGEM